MKKKLKGFTLIELIVVIAIIGVLSAIIVPSYMNWIAMTKVRKQNNNARVIFNAAQTVVQEYRFRERKEEDSKKSVGNGEFYFYWDGHTGAATGEAANVGNTDFLDDFSHQLNKMYGDSSETVYRVYVDNYMVKSVVAASGDNSRHKGSYPEKQKSTNSTSIQTFDMTSIVLP